MSIETTLEEQEPINVDVEKALSLKLNNIIREILSLESGFDSKILDHYYVQFKIEIMEVFPLLVQQHWAENATVIAEFYTQQLREVIELVS